MTARAIILLLVITVAAAAGVGWYTAFGGSAESLQVPGVVETQEVRLGSKIGGRVAEVLVKEGDRVKAGQVLVRFEVPELIAQHEQIQAELAMATAEFDKAKNGPRFQEKEAAQAMVEAAQARWQRIKKGSRDEEIRHAKAQLATTQANLKHSRDEFDRVSRLHKQRSVAQSDFDAAQAAKSRDEGLHAAAQATLDLLLAGNRPEDIEEAAAQIRQAEAQYSLLSAGTRSEEIAAAEARVLLLRGKLTEIEAHLREAEVRAPEDAIIEIVAVRKGDLAPANQPVIRILKAGDQWVKLYVPETELGKVLKGQKVEVTVDSYPYRRFPGTVSQIASMSEFTPRNVQSLDGRRHQMFGVKVLVEDPKGVFKAGMAAQVYIPLTESL